MNIFLSTFAVVMLLTACSPSSSPISSSSNDAPSIASLESIKTLLNDPHYSKSLETMADRAETWYSKKDWGFVAGGSCAVSCHTTIPFILADPLVTQRSQDVGKAMYMRLSHRVDNWASVEPFYDWVPLESRVTEAVLNAVAMINFDSKVAAELSPSTCKAIAQAFDLQNADGGFSWMNENLQPFEMENSAIWGAAIFNYSLAGLEKLPATALSCLSPDHNDQVRRLQTYLARHAETAALHDRLWILISDAAWNQPFIYNLTASRKIIDEAVSLKRSDHGMRLKDLGVKPKGNFSYQSDTYASSLVALAALMTNNKEKIGDIEQWLKLRGDNAAFPPYSYNRPENAWNNLLYSDANKGLWLLYQKVRAEKE